ncbi:MAG TPA: hypothetical protein VGH89_07600 [Pseudonocardia sp.]|jgi:hypothetical protein
MTPGEAIRRRHLFGEFGVAGLLVLSGVLAAALPGLVVLVCLALALVAGVLAVAWAWLTSDPECAGSPLGQVYRMTRFGVSAGAVGGAAGLVLAWFALLFGPASVAVLLATYALAATLGCLRYS